MCQGWKGDRRPNPTRQHDVLSCPHSREQKSRQRGAGSCAMSATTIPRPKARPTCARRPANLEKRQNRRNSEDLLSQSPGRSRWVTIIERFDPDCALGEYRRLEVAYWQNLQAAPSVREDEWHNPGPKSTSGGAAAERLQLDLEASIERSLVHTWSKADKTSMVSSTCSLVTSGHR